MWFSLVPCPSMPTHCYAGTAAEIEHFSFECAHEDKLLVTMAMLKLGLVRKKALIFVNTVDRVRGQGRVCIEL
jgi:hypothetical protein